MSSSLAEKNKEWSPEPADCGANVNRRHETGTSEMNRSDDRFVAVYTAMSPNRNEIPAEVLDWLYSPEAPMTSRFVDKSNPFYDHDTDMAALVARGAETAVEKIREMGYEVEYRDDVSQFKFTPRPTVGEIIIRKKDIYAAVEE